MWHLHVQVWSKISFIVSNLFREKCEPFEEKVCKQVLDQECTEIEKELCVNLDETVTEEICDDGKIENICEDQTEEVSNALFLGGH